MGSLRLVYCLSTSSPQCKQLETQIIIFFVNQSAPVLMSNYSKESVLEWVTSSEARAAKYEQEAKDLLKKISLLEEKLSSCSQELEEKEQFRADVEAQEEVMQIAIVKRRERMMLLQDRADQKLERVKKMEIQQSILNGSFLNEGFQESLKPSTFVSDVQNIAERSRASFNDILGLTKEISTHGRAGGSHGHLCNSQHQTKFLQQAEHERFTKDYKDFKLFQLNLNTKRQEIEMAFKEKRARMRMSLGSFLREKGKIQEIKRKIL